MRCAGIDPSIRRALNWSDPPVPSQGLYRHRRRHNDKGDADHRLGLKARSRHSFERFAVARIGRPSMQRSGRRYDQQSRVSRPASEQEQPTSRACSPPGSSRLNSTTRSRPASISAPRRCARWLRDPKRETTCTYRPNLDDGSSQSSRGIASGTTSPRGPARVASAFHPKL